MNAVWHVFLEEPLGARCKETCDCGIMLLSLCCPTPASTTARPHPKIPMISRVQVLRVEGGEKGKGPGQGQAQREQEAK